MTGVKQEDGSSTTQVSSSGPAAVQLPSEAKPSQRQAAARATLTSLDELIAAAYAAKGRRLALKSKDFDLIAKNIAISEKTYVDLEPAFLSNTGLSVALELIYLCRRLRDRPSVRVALHEFIARALRAHPTFASSPELLAALANLPDAPSPRTAFRLIAEPPGTLAQAGSERPRQTRKSDRAGRVNAIACLAEWMQGTRAYPLETMVRDLHDVLWERAATRLKDETARSRALIGKPTLEGLGLVGRVFRDVADHQAQLAEVARRGEAHARSRADALAKEVETLRADLAARERRLTSLEHELTATRAQRDVDLSHTIDDHARLRARFVRLLRDEGRLLEEGLHALRRNPPKTSVMEDHGERVLEALRNALQQLESGN